MLVADRDFKCGPTVCYGVGAIHDRFKALQALLNRFASAATFAPLAVDGFLGAKVVQALATLQLATLDQPIAGVAANIDALITQLSARAATALTSTTVAAAPIEIVAAIQQTLDACRINARDVRCTRAQTLCRQVRGTPLAQDPTIAQLCQGVETARRRRAVLIGISSGTILTSLVGLFWQVRPKA